MDTATSKLPATRVAQKWVIEAPIEIDIPERPHDHNFDESEGKRGSIFRVAGIQQGSLAEGDQCSRLHPANYQPYESDESFLAPATERTRKMWDRLNELLVEERKKGVLDISQVPSSITSHAAGYIDRENEIISACKPMLRSSGRSCRAVACAWSVSALEAYGYAPEAHVVESIHQIPEDT